MRRLVRQWPLCVGIAGLALLTGCADPSLTQLEATLSDIRQMPSGEPAMVIPYVPLYPAQRYQHSNARSPFLPPESIPNSASGERLVSENAPDQQRSPEPLERFSLQELQLVGTLQMGTRNVAMVAAPDGEVVTVREGNYVGTDYGRITAISDQKVRITERVYTRQNGWQSRPATLTIDDERLTDDRDVDDDPATQRR
ncbi:pilus assembly protein PilP [Vreelandella arcis]|uniref:Type IV pilus assembly protein PilP n=1 Tax=Vreelandella arcis TaxID=416873 RepID=A0A1H0B9F8_9GAMM|nr:pilus assembly protein PilP [Halomonas arcis]SDN42276.1 type IV pilus assembly protein PilP [Halomonas arcis]